MTLTSRLFTLIGALTLACSSFAGPETCPSVSAIKAEGLSTAMELFPKVYYAYNVSEYGSDYSWFFAVGLFASNTKTEAVAEGNKYLPTLTGNPIPLHVEDYWFCDYEIDGGLAAVAVYTDVGSAPLKIKRFFHQIH
ncbi:DUF4949 domain-containing protein [Legionella micdadei]|uniref:Putative Hemin binding protein Hbp n=1 Tax=Legionella micdadei TaxID=451 RepID=A0A098GAE1_LEGMI|nr:DUF4949 domain-containing protein [Legionella micdadei]ARG96223.1 hypothetical protein B6N58_00115 [Legionella micdadei]ARG98978.1 hypothetical protein B6V88_00115 [Legionella micdadei]KTD29035.1 hemin binding protein [Legionella micdadei]CEG59398.1 putative Hemin binding protein Hbp [Legionella micdadei]SCY00450.1 protein of unknown function [Legionella micdadei]